MRGTPYRIGQIVPSSNLTMETEIPALLAARQLVRPERFTFHSARMRMKTVRREELAAMDAQSDRCALELSDAQVDVLGYACLVATMSMGPGYHRVSEKRLHQCTLDNGGPAPVVTSAGALVDGLRVLGARRIVLVAPYMKPLTRMVIDYLTDEGYEIIDHIALEIPDNLDVARHDPGRLPDIVAKLNHADADAIVTSACVQMPSLPVVPMIEAQTGKPVLSAAIATTYAMLTRLGLERIAPGGGALLSGAY
ncbi:maleate cis-trans isomerase family protein [Komagataeibacter intermedius]|uniref:Maleate isomerase n=2 Tax=Komagataeibacter intermedius TaxID=66229 RepID=A0A0N1F9N2_9PROT|nr:Asp/Glu racemase [Komagataeibacter intermedius]KPH85585.1 Asp/Glu racemase [Komagataeibacter intermedius AF2]GAN88076.1 Asp/Glu racemase [Komagataeibacter intermedius TF2]GBQ77740.1 Asp/Glu racemase [Komagataeibacter intermedius NRIC 0521]